MQVSFNVHAASLLEHWTSSCGYTATCKIFRSLSTVTLNLRTLWYYAYDPTKRVKNSFVPERRVSYKSHQSDFPHSCNKVIFLRTKNLSHSLILSFPHNLLCYKVQKRNVQARFTFLSLRQKKIAHHAWTELLINDIRGSWHSLMIGKWEGMEYKISDDSSKIDEYFLIYAL